jgi:hypothetical protein
MKGFIIELIIWWACGGLMFLFAYLIGVKGKMELIAGYNARTADRVTDKEGLRRLITRLLVLVGIACVFLPLMRFFIFTGHEGYTLLVGGFGGFMIGVIGMVMLQTRDYTR